MSDSNSFCSSWYFTKMFLLVSRSGKMKKIVLNEWLYPSLVLVPSEAAQEEKKTIIWVDNRIMKSGYGINK